jgi:putative membrane protein insertion efficiency factor
MTPSETISELSTAPRARPGKPPGHRGPRGPLAAFSARVLLFLIQLYRHTFSPAQTFLFGADHGCRFTPTCSQYALGAIREHGTLTGSLLALKRICRCHPFASCGHDPVPSGRETAAKIEILSHTH